MKLVIKKISVNKHAKIIEDFSSSSNGFAVAFGNKDEFSRLRIEITFEINNSKRVFEIESCFLPTNKSNTTRFRLVEGENGVDIKWCRKVAGNMVEVE